MSPRLTSSVIHLANADIIAEVSETGIHLIQWLIQNLLLDL